ncbi:MAG: VacJ family lipoprotein [Azoarcus sp.]|jgi:phospholipid-binding lipoprotein MlaA|nr:VacJ family lipoprotein [Azoarcus sp.]
MTPACRRAIQTIKKTTLSTVTLLLAVGCANAPPDDPLEPYNRAMFSFNEKTDALLVEPAAKVWVKVTPNVLRTWVSNFFGNIRDPWIGINNILQGNPADGLNDIMRFVFNSTLGIGGILDIASEAQMPKHDKDFGQTLGVWGVKEGPYVVLPFFGPRTMRDAIVLPIDTTAENPLMASFRTPLIQDSATRYVLMVTKGLNARANVLGLERTLDEATLDKYRYARDFYLQQRRYKVFGDSALPQYENFDDDGETNPPTPPSTGEKR